MNKKIAIASLCLGLCAFSAFASSQTNRTYLGFDIQSDFLDYTYTLKNDSGLSGFPDNKFTGFSIFGGYRWNEFGVELGINGVGKRHYYLISNPNLNIEQHNYNLYIDGIYYHALTNKLNLKGLVGIGYLKTRFDGHGISIDDNGYAFFGTYDNDKSSAGIRIGIGAEYYLFSSVSTSLMYKFQTGNDFAKSLQTIAVGLAYHF